MLRRRSRGVSSKQGPMTDHSSPTSPIPKHSKPATNPLFASPRLFVRFSPKSTSDCEATMSPTSILENKTLASVVNPFFSDKNPRKALLMSAIETRHHPWDNEDAKAVGLGIVDALKNDGINDKSSKPERSMVLFGSQLRIQIPNPVSPNVSFESPRSPIEFGIKTKNSQLALLSPVRRSPMGSGNLASELMAPSPRVVTGQLSETEMELSRSEDYTCVISHGPNPRTTHIFDTCDIECCSNGFAASRTEDRFVDDRTGHCSDDILSFCHACKKSLDLGEDIFVYRGEKAFCSVECRCQEMLFDHGMVKCSSDTTLTR